MKKHNNKNNNNQNEPVKKIYTTTDYERFVFREDNRAIDDKHVRKLVNSMTEDGWLEGSVIEVSGGENGTPFVIEEGQHRYVAAQFTKTPLRYMITEKKDVYEIAKKNSLVKKWTLYDFMKAYADSGMYSYQYIRTLVMQFPEFTLNQILMACKHSGSVSNESFRRGTFRMIEKEFHETREVLTKTREIKNALDNIGRADRAYISPLFVLVREGVIDEKRMHEKIEKHGVKILEPVAKVTQAVEKLEKLYNHNVQTKNCVSVLYEYKNITGLR